MRIGNGFPLATAIVISLGLLANGCAKSKDAATCAVDLDKLTGPKSGTGKVFQPDPETSSQLSGLAPGAPLDGYAVQTTLANFGGQGVLAGANVDVRSGKCDDGYGASTSNGAFLYTHADPHFQEVMAYAHGDRYRAAMRASSSLVPEAPVELIAHCWDMDNAYFYRARDLDGVMHQIVCLGDSIVSPGSSYADDAMVIVHELQHSMTVNAYDSSINLNRFFYDEAGALNEGLSDFLALAHFRSTIPAGVDEKIFSPWALGSFFAGVDHSRSVHRCPAFSADFAGGCTGFSTVEDSPWSGFSAHDNRVSFTYPDGLGWPTVGNKSLREIHANYGAREEIHANSVVLSGALWDAYAAILAGRANDYAGTETSFLALVRSTIMAMPKPSTTNQSPVTIPIFAAKLLDKMATVGGFTAAEIDSARHALALRGLTGVTQLPSGWASVGPGGVRVHDNPSELKDWLNYIGGNPGMVHPLAQVGDGKLGPGELAAVFFDVANLSPFTAGGVMLTATSTDPDIKFVDGSANVAPLSSQSAQVMVVKINGTNIVSALRDDTAKAVATSASYFGTHPRFDYDPTNALWVQVERTAAHGKHVIINVEAKPANGAASVVPFEVVLQ